MGPKLLKSQAGLHKETESAAIKPRFWQGALILAGMTLAASAANAATCGAPAAEINPGTSVPGVTGTICDGSTTSPSATGSSITTIFLGASAANTDLLTIDLSGTTIINNQTTTAGHTTTVGVTPGTIGLHLTDTSTGPNQVYNSGQAYTNTDGATDYHFADFTFANAAAYDAFAPFDSVTGNLTAAEISTILADGGFGAWVFIGAEDLPTTSNDDWNDMIFAIGPAATPIPAALPLFAAGLGLVGMFARRKKRTTSVLLAS